MLRIRCDREVLASTALRSRTDVVRTRHSILNQQIRVIHERRLNLGRRPVWVQRQSTAADPAMCGVAIEVPWKKAQPEPSPGNRHLVHAGN